MSLQSVGKSGFTIVELLIVVVVIAILAVITIVSYNGITQRATEASLQSDLRNSATKLGVEQVKDGSYPHPDLPGDIKPSTGNTFQYTSDGDTFCLSVTSGSLAYHISNSTPITTGVCSGHSSGDSVSNGTTMQTITNSNCPAVRTRVVDARDNHTYWIQKLADDKCWMLTNLAYAGGGANAHSDVVSLTQDPGDLYTYTTPSYYVVGSTTNYTTEPANPSISVDGTGQYGYLYNWCAAMGAQLSSSACTSSATPLPNVTLSVCPAGWRLPTGNGGEFGALNTAINGGSTTSDAGLRDEWLSQLSGLRFNTSATDQGSTGRYWSSTQASGTNTYALYAGGSLVNAASFANKRYGFAVRCVIN